MNFKLRRVIIFCIGIAPGAVLHACTPEIYGRASMFTFLCRAVHEHAGVDEEYEKVTLIWSPEPLWLEFANTVMADHQIDFEPL